MSNKKIYIACDHAGFDLKESLIKELTNKLDIIDLGCNSKASVDYPDYANKIAEKLKNDDKAFGILICGTGIGISIAANRHKHIRAAICHDNYSAKMARKHNNANIVVFGSRIIAFEDAVEIIKLFLSEEFEANRHDLRVKKLS